MRRLAPRTVTHMEHAITTIEQLNTQYGAPHERAL
jgi:hypothetical protein